MLCAISGEAPQVPVASRKSGNVFERRLIEAHIAEHGTDPVNGEPLTVEDLVELHGSSGGAMGVRPRPPTFTSIPAMLSAFQNEWDALALESFTLKQHLAQTRQELSTALYQNDAATRVIARLTRERDEARDALSRITVSGRGGASTAAALQAAAGEDAMQVDTPALPEAVVQNIEATQNKLSSTRRKRPIPEDWATADTIGALDTVHSPSEPLYPGSRVLAVDKRGEVVIFGGAGGEAAIYSLVEQRVVHTIKVASGGNITAAVWWNARVIVATSKGEIKIFEDDAELASLPESHAGTVTGLTVHPSGEILVSSGADKSWKVFDLMDNKFLTNVFTDSALTCISFHPDGHLIAAGAADGQIKLFDAKTTENAANYAPEDSSPGAIEALDFSENGTFLASVVRGSSSADVWDLRKSAVSKRIETDAPAGASLESVKWDYTGQFLALAGRDAGVSVHMFEKKGKSWSEVLRKGIGMSAVAFGKGARQLAGLTKEGGILVLGEKVEET
ncbi:cell cycle control protein cwf8 [Lineolata rhizophorae]|uniref:Pre-mRNA-processing factor 19 n=1 Tax=Lineolata rhizophorae TaxID=578093 RepID=A0A6A6NLM1_9PEZI|nr:cell cycle control protein cwf8 [Lineolata rhizophorae]